MSSVGWIGLGKLGAPCAAALALHGDHVVWGYDVRGVDPNDYPWESQPPIELCDSVAKVVAETDDVVYVAVQTPHSPDYGGETVAPFAPREFEYAFLANAVREVCQEAEFQRKEITLVVVSTVLPGTFDRYLRPLLNRWVTPVYHPFFIAMGTVVDDFTQPEMILFGADDPEHVAPVEELYNFHNAPSPTLSIASAELVKVAYNTFISMKIVYANALAEMCDVTGADVDEVTGALSYGTDRLLSTRYLRAGMGDGGACHPRDNVALSALAQRHNLSVDVMNFLTRARESQTRRQAELVVHWQRLTGLPVVILGRSYKPGVELVDGSPALLLAEFLRDHALQFTHVDRVTTDDVRQVVLTREAVYFVATQHPEFASLEYPAGSVVIDPFGYVQTRQDVTFVTPGRKR